MSQEIIPTRSTPPPVEPHAAGDRDLEILRREVIESRNLVIKTDNLLKNLHAELKQMGRKQEMFEKRHMMTSVAAYILFATIATIGAFTFARSEIRGAREEAIANEGRAKQLTQEVEAMRRAESARRDASEKAARAYELLGSEKEGPGQTLAMDQALHLDRQLLSRLEGKALDDRAAGLKVKMAQAALERGNAAFRHNDWGGTAQELTLLLRSLAKARYSPQDIGHYGLGISRYAHFTSPIRRYSDLVNHRQVHAWVAKERPAADLDLVAVGDQISETEVTAMDAERMAIAVKCVRFMQPRLGEGSRVRDAAVRVVAHRLATIRPDGLVFDGLVERPDMELERAFDGSQARDGPGRCQRERHTDRRLDPLNHLVG